MHDSRHGLDAQEGYNGAKQDDCRKMRCVAGMNVYKEAQLLARK